MAHNFYVDLDDETKDAFYDASVDERLNPANIDDYPYERWPSIGAKVVRSSDWLPDYLTDAVWDEFSSNQAQMYADVLTREVRGHKFDEPEDSEARRILNIVQWFRYWSDHDVEIYGGP